MEIILRTSTIASHMYSVWVEGVLVGHIRQTPEEERWVVMPKGTGPKPSRRVYTKSYLSREAAACALSCHYYEGEKEARSVGDASTN